MNTRKAFKVIRECYHKEFEIAVQSALDAKWEPVAWFCAEEPHPSMESAAYFTVYLTREERAAPGKDAAEKEA